MRNTNKRDSTSGAQQMRNEEKERVSREDRETQGNNNSTAVACEQHRDDEIRTQDIERMKIGASLACGSKTRRGSGEIKRGRGGGEKSWVRGDRRKIKWAGVCG